MEPAIHQHAISLIARLLRDRTGQVISEDRRWRVDRAIETVLRDRGVTSSNDILTLLTQPDADAVERELIEALLNNETYFFRDRQVFSHLAGTVLPALCRVRSEERTLRIWSAGCSTGQEPLSLAIMLIELGLTRGNGWTIDLVGTDISHAAIDAAKAGRYSRFEIQRGLGVGQMLRHFEEEKDGWQASRQLLGMVRYQVGNVLEGPPPGPPFDLILCRNLLIYFDDDAKRRACASLRKALAGHGRLLLGGGEGTLEPTSGLVVASPDCALYRCVERALAA